MSTPQTAVLPRAAQSKNRRLRRTAKQLLAIVAAINTIGSGLKTISDLPRNAMTAWQVVRVFFGYTVGFLANFFTVFLVASLIIAAILRILGFLMVIPVFRRLALFVSLRAFYRYGNCNRSGYWCCCVDET
jgi:flagellar biosynthesis protein FliP